MKKSFLAIFTLIFCLSAAQCKKANSKKTIYLYAHGLADTGEQAYNYDGVLFTGPVITFNFPDATKEFYRVKAAEVNLGQGPDISFLGHYYHKELEDALEDDFVGIGCSRGASTWLNFMGNGDPKENVKALILESPFDAIANTVDPVIHYLLPKIFKKYDPNKISPRDSIAKIPKELPILIICAKDDHRVPFASSVEVYRLLRDSGHDKTHILVFESGKHGKISLGHNRQAYRDVAQAFYKKYDLPYNAEQAHAGQGLFEKTQPKPEDL